MHSVFTNFEFCNKYFSTFTVTFSFDPALHLVKDQSTGAYKLQLCIGLAMSGMLTMAHCSDVSNQANFQDVVQYFCGKWGLAFSNIFLFLYAEGCCITYLIVLGDQLDQSEHHPHYTLSSFILI